MRPFKLLTGEEDYINEPEYNGAMWTFVVSDNFDDENYVRVSGFYHGIGDFLDQFPDGSITLVTSIRHTGSEFTHTFHNQDEPWGFDIQNDWLDISWFRYMGE